MTAAEDPAKGSPEPSNETGPSMRVRSALDQFRSATTWAVAAVGAIGALLVSSLPLADLGKVESRFDRIFAVIGIFLVVGGILFILMTAVGVLRPRWVMTGDIPDLESRDKEQPTAPKGLRAVTSGAAAARCKWRMSRHRNELFPAHLAQRSGPVEGLRRERLNLIRILEERTASPEELKASEEALDRYDSHLEELAWIMRYEQGVVAHRRAVFAVVAGVASVAVGMFLLLSNVRDELEVAATKAATAKVEAETRVLLAGLEKSSDSADCAECAGESEDDAAEEGASPITVTFGDVSYGGLGGGIACDTTPADGADRLDRVSMAVLVGALDSGDLPFVSSAESGRLLVEVGDAGGPANASEAWTVLFGEHPKLACSDWPSVVDEHVRPLLESADVSESEQVLEFVIEEMQSTFRSVVLAGGSSLSTTTVIVDNELNAGQPGMD